VVVEVWGWVGVCWVVGCVCLFCWCVCVCVCVRVCVCVCVCTAEGKVTVGDHDSPMNHI